MTVEYGGWALLTFISGREGLADSQKGFFRAGHAHGGVLLVLSLVYLLYLPGAAFSDALEWVAGSGLLARVLAQAGGFFLHLGVGEQGQPSAGTKLTRAGAAMIAAALVTLAIGLIQTASRPQPGLARRTAVGRPDSLGLERTALVAPRESLPASATSSSAGALPATGLVGVEDHDAHPGTARQVARVLGRLAC